MKVKRFILDELRSIQITPQSEITAIKGWVVLYLQHRYSQLRSEDANGNNVPPSQLIEKQFEPSMLQEFIELFDRGYLQLQLENAQITDWHSSNRVEFLNLLQNKTRSDELRSFWLENQLIGSYLIHNNYIQDLVVNPDYQNCGYGGVILAHCVAHMRANKGIDSVCLRVAKSNWRAKRFYERNHFEELASFAEHTYIPG